MRVSSRPLTAQFRAQFLLWQLTPETEKSFCPVVCRSPNQCSGQRGCMCRFCLIQGNGKHQDDEGLSIPWLLSAAFAIVLDLKEFMEPREEEPGFQSSLSFASKKLYLKSWQYKIHALSALLELLRRL